MGRQDPNEKYYHNEKQIAHFRSYDIFCHYCVGLNLSLFGVFNLNRVVYGGSSAGLAHFRAAEVAILGY